MGIRCADHVTPLYPQKLALTSPTGGGRSVGIVHSRTKATEFIYIYIYIYDISRLRVNICFYSNHADILGLCLLADIRAVTISRKTKRRKTRDWHSDVT